ncbi:NAD(P)-dependent oxidoreductase [Paraburkholderia bonniea]|uniref:NAD-dependent epimerase/dehydratase family protein n=1 Tax=Paraburkholderia bonniea TaxID=2152891 RepID=UPI0025745234|nr:NAD(P)-dependent oxidoreductase [Paraburkholderia bonniea]WJF91467.1 NAD(P)-dependent oxidoreductase [Paraburkholderia bonniea]WJF94786.1 NAD(P)-dependent oxidoreductase [Paraburkholderia bonniea]
MILVTGASGYIGPQVINALLARGHEVIATGRAPSSNDPRIRYIQCDIEAIDSALFDSTGLPDVCLHLAWRNGFMHNANSHIEDLPGHFAFLMRMASLGVRQISVVGSVHEIGYFNGEIDEHTPANPRSLYGIAKNALRAALEIKLPELGAQLQWLRLFYILGDYERGQSVFSKILLKEKEGQAFIPFTSGLNKFDFISLAEVSSQIAAMVSQSEINGIIHGCSGRAVTIREKVDEFIEQQGLSIRPQYGLLPGREYDSPCIFGNATKINQILQITSSS